ncbi:aminopeptidase N-like [Odontomachus brunneus]|uniref:aminopeptidase N-like n=1 Tax=Odontomachus brunneus TaxID=486640 RepID=UPI0013F2AEB7|nr:aminopeptidase N-like [Odontomachus brunneus]
MGTIFLKLLFSFAIIFAVMNIVIMSNFEDCMYLSAYDTISLSKVRPEIYNMVFTVKNSSLILGESHIVILVYYTTKRIVIHNYKLAIPLRSIKLTTWNSLTQTPEETYTFERHIYCHKAQTLELTMKKYINPGIYNLNMNFMLPVNVTSLNLSDKYLWSPTVGHELNLARQVFPCWDNPWTKARFNISLNHPTYYTVLSNMPISHTVDEKDGMRRTYFDTSLRIAPYEVGLALVQYLNKESSPTNAGTTMWYRQQVGKYLKHMFAAIEACKRTFDSYIVMLKETPKTDHVIVPNLSMKIRGFPGLVIYREQDFTYNVHSDYPGRNNSVWNMLGQEMARQWFGAESRPSSWSNFLFIEMFASFLNHIITEKLQSKSIRDLYAVQMVQSALRQDFALRMKPVLHEIDIDDKFEKDLYFPMYRNKGVILIRMLYYLFTADDFQIAIQTYFTDVDNALFQPDNLWQYLQRCVHARKQKWPCTVKEIMDMWLTMEHFPEVYVTRNFDKETINISTNCTSNSSIIPITYITQSDLTSAHTWNVTWLKCGEIKTISEILTHDFIIFNLEQSGYYRVNYDTNNWNKIINYLSHESEQESDVLIPIVNIAQLIDDAFYFVMQRKLNSNTFFNLILYLSREKSYTAWYPMFNILSRMSIYLQLPEAEEIKVFIKILLENLLEKIGYEEYFNEDGMTRSLRLLAVRWACGLGSIKCKIVAKNELIKHLRQPDIPIPSWWREWVYCTGMEKLSMHFWQKWMAKCIRERNKTCLTYLSCVHNEIILENYLKMLLGEMEVDEFIKETGSLTLFHTLFKRHANNDIMLAIFINNLDNINDKIYTGNNLNLVKLFREAIGTIYSKSSLNMITTYTRRLKFMNVTLKDQLNELIEFRYNKLNKAFTQFYFLK